MRSFVIAAALVMAGTAAAHAMSRPASMANPTDNPTR